ncbi:DNA topoisomerase IB [Gemmata sp. G18]|uniref:DNA topoisomerase n=1 Tax=Gemmata palustris TaxID=2822762 RepID=A0ABS5C3N5_9BACT|nr:DNA topoisomerase IB [Gemmata palustris]MBP3960095.1 DNA topoisomerase IB [Gemmata palustris]
MPRTPASPTKQKKSASPPFTFPVKVRLRLWCDTKPALKREPTGSGFRYRAPDGRVVRCAVTLARIRALVIPPAWTNVLICPDANGHLQAIGFDARGRKQYRYHPAFRAKRDGTKYDRVLTFGLALSRVRTRVELDLRRRGLSRDKVLAAVVKLLDRTHLRIGNAEYVRANRSFGLSTLLDRHVTFTRGTVRIKFRGKSGVEHDRIVSDAKLARLVRQCRDLPGQDLFQYRAGAGSRPIGSADVNAYIQKAAGAEFTAKDFRTWAGTVKAATKLAALPKPETKTEAERAVCGVVREVAAELGNTPAVCRKSYIHPSILEAFTRGGFAKTRARGQLSADEARVIRLLGG